MGSLGIIAGEGELPAVIAESARAAGRDVFVLALLGNVDEELLQFPHERVSVGELGRSLGALRKHNCDSVTLAGKVPRPDWGNVKFDARGALALPKVIAAGLKGDDAILRTMIGIFENDGFKVVGTSEAAPELIAGVGVYGRHKPDAQASEDMALAFRVVRSMGEYDIGQAAAVCEGLVLAVEAAEGTDAMLARIALLPKAVRGTPEKRRGVVVKAAKPHQDHRVDLPVVGLKTIELAAASGLIGVAVEAGTALLMRKAKIVEIADRLGLFVLGFDAAKSA